MAMLFVDGSDRPLTDLVERVVQQSSWDADPDSNQRTVRPEYLDIFSHHSYAGLCL